MARKLPADDARPPTGKVNMHELLAIQQELRRISGMSATRTVVATRDLYQARQKGCEVLGPHRLQAQTGSSLQFFELPLSTAKIFALAYTGPTVINPCGPADHFTVAVVLKGSLSFCDGNRTLIGISGYIVSMQPSPKLQLNVDGGTVVLGVRIPRETLERRLGLLASRPTTAAIDLTCAIEPSPVVNSVLTLLSQCLVATERTSILAPGVAIALEEALITLVLLGVPGNHTPSFSQIETRRRTRDLIHEAAELMRQSASDCPSLEKIAAQVGVSVRRLQAGFQNVLGTTPSKFMRDIRLDAVHRKLELAPREKFTISELATAEGFTHLGRFSAEYKRRFGVTPSDRLRQGANRKKPTGQIEIERSFNS